MAIVTIEGTIRLENILDEISEYRDFVHRMIKETVEKRRKYLEEAYRKRSFLFIKVYSEEDAKRLAEENKNIIDFPFNPFRTVESLVKDHYNWKNMILLEEAIDYAIESNGKVSISDNDILTFRSCYVRKTPWEVSDYLLETIP